MEPAGLGAIVQRERDRDGQRRSLRDDQQPKGRPQRTSPRLGPGHYDIGVCIASAVVHLIIGSGYWGDVKQAADVRDHPVSPARKHPVFFAMKYGTPETVASAGCSAGGARRIRPITTRAESIWRRTELDDLGTCAV
jgi:hypothetical protein